MSCRDWLHNAAIGGCLIATLLIAPLCAQDNSKQDEKTPQVEKTEQQIAPNSTPLAADRRRPIETDWNKLECGKAQSHPEADLCEQRRMAKAAEDAVFWSYIQALIAIVGTSFLIWNLYYARSATKAATKAANAAQHSVDLASETAKRQLRAYIFNGRVSLDVFETGKHSKVNVKFRNSGQTPAYDLTVVLMINYCQEAVTFDLTRGLIPGDGASRGAVGGGTEFEMNISTLNPIHEKQFAALQNGTWALYIYGQVDYRDVFGDPHQTRFQMYYNWKAHRRGDNRFETAPDGNSAT